MRRLYFSPRYYERLARKEKRVTVRLQTSLEPGEIVEVYSGRLFVGKAKIVRVERVRLADIGAEIVKAEGMRSKSELVEALMEHYGPAAADPNRELYVIRFERL